MESKTFSFRFIFLIKNKGRPPTNISQFWEGAPVFVLSAFFQPALPPFAERDAMGRISTVIIHSDGLLREGLIRILEGTEFAVTATANTLQNLAVPAEPPQLVIIEIGASDRQDLGPLVALRAGYAAAKIVVLTGSPSLDLLAKVLRVGVDGYLLTEISVEAFTRSLQLVVMGQQILPTSVRLLVGSAISKAASAADDAHAPASISNREGQILKCLVDGCSNKEIGRELNLAEATVKVYVKGLLRKIQASNRTQAAVWALNHRIRREPDDATAPAGRSANGAAPEELGTNGKESRHRMAPSLPAVRVAGATEMPPYKGQQG
jgi:two-component system nitrate/nitrite response regulator NarL